MFYKLFVPKQAAGANLVYFDLFNPTGSGVWVDLHSVIPVVSGDVAVVGVVGVDLLLTRTTTVGTGGTAATAEGSSITVPTICGLNNSQPITQVSARLTPAAGATAGAILAWRSVYTEETNAGTYTQIADLVKGWWTDCPPAVVKEGSGIRVVQGAVASVGNIGFDCLFSVRPK